MLIARQGGLASISLPVSEIGAPTRRAKARVKPLSRWCGLVDVHQTCRQGGGDRRISDDLADDLKETRCVIAAVGGSARGS
jgi:hypothetical protein